MRRDDIDPITETPRAGGAPVVSVVIAAYNAETYIGESLRSALGQSHAAIEVIVADDGSTDRTAEIVAGLAAADPRVTLISSNNEGVAAARNRAIRAASGEFIAPLDADDVWAPTKIERQLECFARSGPEMGMVYCWWAWIDEHGLVMDRSPRWRVQGSVYEKLVEVNFTGNASVPMFRRSAIDAVGHYDVRPRQHGAQGCEDWDLALRVAHQHQVGVVSSVLVGYRRHTKGMSTSCEAMWRARAHLVSEVQARQPGISAEALRRSEGQFALYLSGVAFWSGDFVQACRWALRARPVTLMLSVLPHALAIVTRRILGGRLRGERLVPRSGHFEEAVRTQPLIPYDRIYEKHWQRDHE
jgi:glycosyltransferase involved in cell wall biosynthesis